MSVEERTRATLLAAADTIHPNTGAMLAGVEATVHRQRTVRRTALGIGALALAVLAGVLGLGVLQGRPTGADFDPADGSEGAQVFTFAEHDLCSWFEPIEVAGFLGSQYEWTGGPDEVVAEPAGESGGCWWRLSALPGQEPYQVHAWNAEPWTLRPADVVAFDGGVIGTQGMTVTGHPALSEGVALQSAGRGVFVLWVPPAEEYLALTVTTLTSSGVREMAAPATADSQARHFSVANQFVQGLGWVQAAWNEPYERVFEDLKGGVEE